MMKVSALLSLVAGAAASNLSASTVCVYNDAGFVLKWKLSNSDDQKETSWTGHYPVWTNRCIEATDLEGVKAGAHLVPNVHAFWGKTITADFVTYDPINAAPVTFVCKGTTLDYDCVAGPPPPPAAEVAKHVGRFVEGFVEGLAVEIGFATCLADVKTTVQDLRDVVAFFEDAFNKQLKNYVGKAFQKIGTLLKDFAAAITVCAAEATKLVKQFKDLATALSGDVFSIIEVIVKEGVHIWKERKDLTADCKAVAADWKATDYEGSGKAVGGIVGILIAGLEALPNATEASSIAAIV